MSHRSPWKLRRFLAREMDLGSVLTRNRYRDEVGAQGYFHQFGIGPSGSAGIFWVVPGPSRIVPAPKGPAALSLHPL